MCIYIYIYIYIMMVVGARPEAAQGLHGRLGGEALGV